MFTKNKVLVFAAACAVFLGLDLWMFSVLKGSFEKTVLADRKQIALAVARSAPADPADVEGWLQSAGADYPDLRLLYLPGTPGVDPVAPQTLDGGLRALWESESGSPAFVEGLDAASYLEVFTTREGMRIGDSSARIVFAPVATEAGDAARGILVAAIDDAGLRSFKGLADTLAAIAIAVFALGFGVATFSRDPITGYAILVLFGVAIVFVAYPLFEALRLTVLKDGRLSLEVWKEVLGNTQYLEALGGSVELGALTASLSTLVGFLFAFAVARTSMKGKKALTALATLPVISHPFLPYPVDHPPFREQWPRSPGAFSTWRASPSTASAASPWSRPYPCFRLPFSPCPASSRRSTRPSRTPRWTSMLRAGRPLSGSRCLSRCRASSRRGSWSSRTPSRTSRTPSSSQEASGSSPWSPTSRSPG